MTVRYMQPDGSTPKKAVEMDSRDVRRTEQGTSDGGGGQGQGLLAAPGATPEPMPEPMPEPTPGRARQLAGLIPPLSGESGAVDSKTRTIAYRPSRGRQAAPGGTTGRDATRNKHETQAKQTSHRETSPAAAGGGVSNLESKVVWNGVAPPAGHYLTGSEGSVENHRDQFPNFEKK